MSGDVIIIAKLTGGGVEKIIPIASQLLF